MKLVSINDGQIELFNTDVLSLYDYWETPMVIISDGPYGVSGFSGDLPTCDNLANWYEPHIKKWSEKSSPQTTLWFWNTELGWATVHPVLVRNGWSYKCCNIWDKGLAHIAGNTNTKNLSKLPVVTEVCVQYVKNAEFSVGSKSLSMKEWLRYEWNRTGLPFSKTNDACNVKDAATRKYFTKCHLWYMPPSEAFEKLVHYANKHGDPSKRPYFSLDGIRSLTKDQWDLLKPKFYCPFGKTNVWHEPPIHGKERLKKGAKAVHANQKPLSLIELSLQISSDENDLIWEPFGGLCTAAVASLNLNRKCKTAEIDPKMFASALTRFEQIQLPFCPAKEV